LKFESVAPALIAHMTANIILTITAPATTAALKLLLEAIL
jgi:hypothetical protein